MAYRIEYKSSIANDLRKIDKKEAKRIIDKIEKDLTEDPAYGTPLKGRMCFELETRTMIVLNLKVIKILFKHIDTWAVKTNGKMIIFLSANQFQRNSLIVK